MTTFTVTVSDLKRGDTFRLRPTAEPITVAGLLRNKICVYILATDGRDYNEAPSRPVELLPKETR